MNETPPSPNPDLRPSPSREPNSDSNSEYEDGFSARRIAANALVHVYDEGAALDTALINEPGFLDLSPRDRAFARLLAATTLRRTGQIDKVLKKFLSKRPFEPTYTVLRLGAAQLLFLKTPPHAAVDSSVNVLKANKKTKAMSGLANAVLRKVAAQGPQYLANTRPLDNIPPWLRDSWSAAYGKGNVRKMANILVADPPLDIQLKDRSEANLQKWAQGLGANILQDGTLRLAKTEQVTGLSGFDDGAWWVQDTSASLPVKLLGDIKGSRVLDMCAAPGGKTLQLAARGANVIAIDKNEDRLVRTKQNLQRTGLKAQIITADGGDWIDPEHPNGGGFDIVLLDAPCSSTGTFRRHPDVLLNKSPKDIRGLVGLQKRLLKAAATHVKPGGTLVYCTCSLETRESEDQVAWFEKNQPEFRLNSDISSSALVVEGAQLPNGTFRILPDMNADLGGMDGFFTAIFTRR